MTRVERERGGRGQGEGGGGLSCKTVSRSGDKKHIGMLCREISVWSHVSGCYGSSSLPLSRALPPSPPPSLARSPPSPLFLLVQMRVHAPVRVGASLDHSQTPTLVRCSRRELLYALQLRRLAITVVHANPNPAALWIAVCSSDRSLARVLYSGRQRTLKQV